MKFKSLFKTIFGALLITLLSSCTIIANKNGVGVYGQGGSASISSETITLIVVVVIIGVLIAGGAIAALIIVFAKKIKQQRAQLDKDLAEGKITKEQYDEKVKELGKFWQKR